MKLFKSTIMAMLGLAVSLTACSDDDDYTMGAQSPGAYFAADAPATVALPQTGSSFDVTVYRTGADAPDTYAVAMEDASGLFTAPTSVTFAESELTTKLTITFDETTVVTDKNYPITLTLSGATEYGKAQYSFNAKRATPLKTEVVGTAVWTLTQYWNGTMSDLKITKTYNPATPNEVTFSTGTNPANTPMLITCPDISAVKDGAVEVFVKPQYIGTDNAQYGKIYVADIYSYYKDYLGWEGNAAEVVGASYYEPERGLFSLDLIYYVPEYGEGTSYFGEGYEYIQLDGFPDYSIEVEYLGTMIKPDGSYAANIQITPGEDVAKSVATIVPGDDEAACLKAILAGTDVQEFAGAKEVVGEFDLKEGGLYTVGAVTYDSEGEPAEFAATSFEVFIGDKPYTEIGTGSFVDGWILAGYSMGGKPIDVLNFMWDVPVLQSTKDKNIIYLNSPWTQEDCPILANNNNTKEYRIQFDITTPKCVLMVPQISGFNEKEMIEVGDFGGMLAQENPGISVNTIYNYLLSKDVEPSYLEDGIIEVSLPLFSQGGEFGYNWKNIQTGYVVLPDAKAESKARVAARRVTRPAKAGMLRVVNANSVAKSMRDQNLHIPVLKQMTKDHTSPRLRK